MAKTKRKKLNIIRSGMGSFQYIKEHKSKGIFYTVEPKTSKVILIENIAKYKESMFDNVEELEKYIRENYSAKEWDI